jgi:hypothetical protein
MSIELHEMPRNFDNLLLKFNPDKLGSPEDHVNNLFLAIHILGVEHDDVVCGIFPYTFLGKSSTWYFILPVESIIDWDSFKILIMRKEKRKTFASLQNELGAIKMEKRERVKDCNQRFLNFFIKFPHEVDPTKSLSIDYHTVVITPSIGMFVKRSNKNTLALNFDGV